MPNPLLAKLEKNARREHFSRTGDAAVAAGTGPEAEAPGLWTRMAEAPDLAAAAGELITSTPILRGAARGYADSVQNLLAAPVTAAAWLQVPGAQDLQRDIAEQDKIVRHMDQQEFGPAGYPEQIAQGVTGAVSDLAHLNALGLAGRAATALGFGGLSTARASREAAGEGLNTAGQIIHAIPQGAIEAGMTYLMPGGAEQLFKPGARAAAQGVARGAGGEIVEEVSTGAGQKIAAGFTLPSEARKAPGQRVQEFVESLPVTAATAGIVGGAGHYAAGRGQVAPPAEGAPAPAPGTVAPAPDMEAAAPAPDLETEDPTAAPQETPRARLERLRALKARADAGEVIGGEMEPEAARASVFSDEVVSALESQYGKMGGKVTARPDKSAVEVQLPGQNVLIVPMSDTTAQELAMAQPGALWASLTDGGRNPLVLDGKVIRQSQFTPAMVKRLVAEGRVSAGGQLVESPRIRTPLGEEISLDRDALIYLTEGDLPQVASDAEHERIHLAAYNLFRVPMADPRAVTDEDLTGAAQIIAPQLAGVAPADLRQSTEFHEALRGAYTEWLSAGQPKQGPVGRFFAKLRDFLRRLLGIQARATTARETAFDRVATRLRGVMEGETPFPGSRAPQRRTAAPETLARQNLEKQIKAATKAAAAEGRRARESAEGQQVAAELTALKGESREAAQRIEEILARNQELEAEMAQAREAGETEQADQMQAVIKAGQAVITKLRARRTTLAAKVAEAQQRLKQMEAETREGVTELTQEEQAQEEQAQEEQAQEEQAQEEQAQEEQAQEEQAQEEGAHRPIEVKVRKQRPFKPTVSPDPNNAEDMVFRVAEMGGIRPPIKKSGGEYDEFMRMPEGLRRAVSPAQFDPRYGERGLPIDEMVSVMREQGSPVESAEDLVAQLEKAWTARQQYRRDAAQGRREQEEDEAELLRPESLEGLANAATRAARAARAEALDAPTKKARTAAAKRAERLAAISKEARVLGRQGAKTEARAAREADEARGEAAPEIDDDAPFATRYFNDRGEELPPDFFPRTYQAIRKADHRDLVAAAEDGRLDAFQRKLASLKRILANPKREVDAVTRTQKPPKYETVSQEQTRPIKRKAGDAPMAARTRQSEEGEDARNLAVPGETAEGRAALRQLQDAVAAPDAKTHAEFLEDGQRLIDKRGRDKLLESLQARLDKAMARATDEQHKKRSYDWTYTEAEEAAVQIQLSRIGQNLALFRAKGPGQRAFYESSLKALAKWQRVYEAMGTKAARTLAFRKDRFATPEQRLETVQTTLANLPAGTQQRIANLYRQGKPKEAMDAAAAALGQVRERFARLLGREKIDFDVVMNDPAHPYWDNPAMAARIKALAGIAVNPNWGGIVQSVSTTQLFSIGTLMIQLPAPFVMGALSLPVDATKATFNEAIKTWKGAYNPELPVWRELGSMTRALFSPQAWEHAFTNAQQAAMKDVNLVEEQYGGDEKVGALMASESVQSLPQWARWLSPISIGMNTIDAFYQTLAFRGAVLQQIARQRHTRGESFEGIDAALEAVLARPFLPEHANLVDRAVKESRRMVMKPTPGGAMKAFERLLNYDLGAAKQLDPHDPVALRRYMNRMLLGFRPARVFLPFFRTPTFLVGLRAGMNPVLGAGNVAIRLARMAKSDDPKEVAKAVHALAMWLVGMGLLGIASAWRDEDGEPVIQSSGPQRYAQANWQQYRFEAAAGKTDTVRGADLSRLDPVGPLLQDAADVLRSLEEKDTTPAAVEDVLGKFFTNIVDRTYFRGLRPFVDPRPGTTFGEGIASMVTRRVPSSGLLRSGRMLTDNEARKNAGTLAEAFVGNLGEPRISPFGSRETYGKPGVGWALLGGAGVSIQEDMPAEEKRWYDWLIRANKGADEPYWPGEPGKVKVAETPAELTRYRELAGKYLLETLEKRKSSLYPLAKSAPNRAVSVFKKASELARERARAALAREKAQGRVNAK